MDLFLTEDNSILNLSSISYIKVGAGLSTVYFASSSPLMISESDYNRIKELVQRVKPVVIKKAAVEKIVSEKKVIKKKGKKK